MTEIGLGRAVTASAQRAQHQNAETQSPAITFDRVGVTYGRGKKATSALIDFDLRVAAGETVALLGPSGSGKSTALNALAGFVRPTSGSVRLSGRDVTNLPPASRGIGVVLQSYALFPHMRVADNVAFGLKAHRVRRAEVAVRVAEALDMVGMSAYGKRLPRELSGGQQQRIAIARALAIRPRVLLLDEPLAALDAQLRQSMLAELQRLKEALPDTAMLYVTHDQSEALALADRIAVMRNSRLADIDTAENLWKRPPSSSTAEFLGGANLLPAEMVASDGGSCDVRIASGHVLRIAAPELPVAPGRRVSVFIRPEDIAVANPPGGRADGIKGVVQDMLYLGDALRLVVKVGPLAISVRAPRSQLDDLAPGRTVALSWASDRARVLVPDPG
jgi:2-aminoethylphosphonate transport system ATP-binding protein